MRYIQDICGFITACHFERSEKSLLNNNDERGGWLKIRRNLGLSATTLIKVSFQGFLPALRVEMT